MKMKMSSQKPFLIGKNLIMYGTPEKYVGKKDLTNYHKTVKESPNEMIGMREPTLKVLAQYARRERCSKNQ